MKVAVILGSYSDFETMKKCMDILYKFKIDFEVSVISAHRSPEKLHKYMEHTENERIELIIAAAGKAAHLPGVIASLTTLPVIGVPIKSSTLDGLDSLLSIVQMPSGIPVATVAIDGSTNAALLAAEMLSIKYDSLRTTLKEYRNGLEEEVENKDCKIKEEANILWKNRK